MLLAYSSRNRSAGIRIPMYSPSPKAKRIEVRFPDPSCNMYLAFSAMLMAGLSRQAVTQHLALLEEANLVVTVWHGREKLHFLNPAPLQEIHERWLDKYEQHRLDALNDLKRALESDKTKVKEQRDG